MLDRPSLALVAKHPYRSGTELEPGTFGYLHLGPARGHDAQDMPMGERRRVPLRRSKPRQDPVRTRAHLWWAFATRTSVSPQVPVGPRLANLRSGEALVLAVIPLPEIIPEP